MTTSFFYDNHGNLTREEAPDGTSTFGYDALNRQVQAVTKDGNTLVSRYDAEGLRAEIEENKKLTKFLYHNGNILTELDKDYTPKVRYTRGNSLVASTLWNVGNDDIEYKNEDSYYYHQDRQGSTIHITDAEENIQNSYRYDAFGMFLENRETIPNRITYTGQQYDSLTGQYYLRARFYNPVIGRFTQEDPFRGDGLNLYAYVSNNPVSYYDPTGYSKCDVSGESGNKTYPWGYTSAPSREWLISQLTDKTTQSPEIEGTGNGGVSEKEYDKAKDALWDAVYKQYPLARARLIKKNTVEDVLKEHKDVINEAGKKYGVPPEIIAGIIVKEQLTQSWPDVFSIGDTIVRGEPHTTGLGATFPTTARKAWYKVDIAGAYMHGIYGTNVEIELKLMADNEASINTIAVVLNYYAIQKFDTKDVSNLSMEQWKEVVGRYNATDDNSKAQKKYSDYVYDYLDPLRTMLK